MNESTLYFVKYTRALRGGVSAQQEAVMSADELNELQSVDCSYEYIVTSIAPLLPKETPADADQPHTNP
jgi:hypothetical protein